MFLNHSPKHAGIATLPPLNPFQLSVNGDRSLESISYHSLTAVNDNPSISHFCAVTPYLTDGDCFLLLLAIAP